jgi:hypothetical protein
MIAESAIAQQLRDLLGSEVDARCDDGRLRVLTPFEYPDGDGVVVLVEQSPDGRFVVSDGGAADATLIGRVGAKAIGSPAAEIARRFGATFDSGQVTTTVEGEADIADACQRIARAAAGVAEAATYLRRQRSKEREFVDVIASKLHQREIDVESQHKLEGASGHPYTATLFVPGSETVIEPIGGERPWNVATAVYVEFGDLSKVNGYRLMAVLDDRETDLGPDVSSLLSQVADVASWREHDSWIAEVAAKS